MLGKDLKCEKNEENYKEFDGWGNFAVRLSFGDFL
jgi:hypothetical protein